MGVVNNTTLTRGISRLFAIDQQDLADHDFQAISLIWFLMLMQPEGLQSTLKQP